MVPLRDRAVLPRDLLVSEELHPRRVHLSTLRVFQVREGLALHVQVVRLRQALVPVRLRQALVPVDFLVQLSVIVREGVAEVPVAEVPVLRLGRLARGEELAPEHSPTVFGPFS
jgi:hypothetical protein